MKLKVTEITTVLGTTRTVSMAIGASPSVAPPITVACRGLLRAACPSSCFTSRSVLMRDQKSFRRMFVLRRGHTLTSTVQNSRLNLPIVSEVMWS